MRPERLPRQYVAAIDLTDWIAGSGSIDAVSAQLRETLAQLRQDYPQIPADRRRLEAAVERVIGELTAAKAGGFDLASLAGRLARLEVKGFGEANAIWPWLVAAVPAPDSSQLIDVARASRTELGRTLRKCFCGYFRNRPEALERAIARVIVARPASLAALHALLEEADPPFLPLATFERSWGGLFSFGAPDRAAAPDWSLYWEGQGQTAYGADYPAGIKAFLAVFLRDLGQLEPRARILDIGTGSHAATRLARGVSPQFDLWGIDLARIGPPPSDANVHAARMSAEKLAFRSESFCAVLSVNGVEYADAALALPEMFRVMRPGAYGALVLHRPDSPVMSRARDIVAFIENAPVLETLALAWLWAADNAEPARRLLARHLDTLESDGRNEISGHAFFRGLWSELRRMLGDDARDREVRLRTIEWCEGVVRWTHEKNRFLTSQVASVAASGEEVRRWLSGYGFVVDRVENLPADAALGPTSMGWGVRFRRPDRADPAGTARSRANGASP